MSVAVNDELRHRKWRPENSHFIIEKALNWLQTLLWGVFDLHGAEQKTKQTPNIEVLLKRVGSFKDPTNSENENS